MRCAWMRDVRHVDDAERRARLAVRHGLAPGHRLDTVEAATEALVCLHATEPATVTLSVWARSGADIETVDRALYTDRTVVKQLAMRRTLFGFPRDLLPAVWGSASARVAAQQRAQVAKEVQQAGLTDDGAAWTDEHVRLARDLIAEHGSLTTSELRTLAPGLDVRIRRGKGTYAADVAIVGQVLTTLAATGEVVRGDNDGTWKTTRHRWTLASDWLGEVPEPLSEPEGYAELVRRWLARFGPGTEADLVWWLGATKGAVRRALADVGAVEVALDHGETGWLLPDDLDLVDDPGPWAALLPALDPTTMGWKGRGFYLGPHAEALFDRNGNGGPSAWWGGRIVGGWTQEPDGRVVVLPAEDLPRAAEKALRAEAERLTALLDGEVVRSIYQSPLARAHAAR